MKQRIIKVVKIYLILFIIFIGYYFIHKFTGFGIPCPFYKLTGYKCPGCGITHCLFDILNLRFKEAFNDNQLVFIMLPFIALYYFYQTYLYIYDKKDQILVKIPKVFKITILIITLLFGVIRNI